MPPTRRFRTGPAVHTGNLRSTRTVTAGPIISCYIRDPDQNLIELSNYAP